jgi:hypothetical protein
VNLLHSFLGWLLEEKRLLLAPNWSAGVYHNRPTVQSVAQTRIFTPECAQADVPPVEPCTRADPACRKVELRQRLVRQMLHDRGIGGPRVPISAGWQHDERAFKFVRHSAR